jgi:hypothetical protein
MPALSLRHVHALAIALLVVSPSRFVSAADAPSAGPPPKSHDSQWVFSLLPKSFQGNPRLELTVVTEMTDAGRKLPVPSPSRPAYFEAFSGGYRVLGDPGGDQQPLTQDEVVQVLTRSLAANGYLPAQRPAHPPSLLIVYSWGTHNLLVESDPNNQTVNAAAVTKNLLDRAALIGGRKFAEELGRVFEEASDPSISRSAAPGGGPTEMLGPLASRNQTQLLDPIKMYRARNEKNTFLLDQVASNVYYVVASAYDYKSAKSNQRVLLWRTRMTVGAQGVSQGQSMPTLVLAAAPYFGRDYPDPAIISKRTVPDGNVQIGTPTVVEPAAPAAK